MFRTLRIAVLLLILVFVAAATRLARSDDGYRRLEPLHDRLAVGDREQDGKVLDRYIVPRNRDSELAFDQLAVQHLDPSDVPGVELAVEVGVRELLRRVTLALDDLIERETEKRDQRPEREVTAQAAPIRGRRARIIPLRHLHQVRNEGEMPKVLRVIQAVPDQERVGGFEPDEPKLGEGLVIRFFIEQRTNGE